VYEIGDIVQHDNGRVMRVIAIDKPMPRQNHVLCQWENPAKGIDKVWISITELHPYTHKIRKPRKD
jgi:hypothetical protein